MDYLEAAVDKFVFRIAADCRYSNADVWAKREANRIRVGLTDYLQQKSGDVAFVNLKPGATVVAAGDELAALETIKVDLVIPSPLAGRVVVVNQALAERPELVNADPYVDGWLVEIEPDAWADFEALPDAQSYLPEMQARAEMERQQ